VTVDLDESEQIRLDFAEGDASPPPAPEETVEVE
jgi:ATP-dependent Clp protease ATP-binding subunit ClpA